MSEKFHALRVAEIMRETDDAYSIRFDVPAEQRPILGGRRGHHSEHLGHVLAIMQHIPRTYPDATW